MAGARGRWVRAALATGALVVVAAGSISGAAGDRRANLRLARIGGFDAPVYVAEAPGARRLVFVVEQAGTISVVRSSRDVGRPFLDIRDRVTYGGEQGLLSVAFDPGYARNRRFYVYYVNDAGNIEIDGFRARRREPTRAKASSRERVIQIPHPVNENHNGGQLQFGPDGHLYLATGDDGTNGYAQDRSVLLGKLLRLDPRKHGGYSIPRSNPFRGRRGRNEIYALGLRNPWRFSFDRRTGAIYIGDVGQDRWEEIDSVGRRRLAGSNFGWPIFEGDHDYQGGGTPGDYHPPIFDYSSATGGTCAVTGGYVVRSSALAPVAGRYLYADLCAGEIRSFDPSNPRASDSATGLSVVQPSSFGEGRGGAIFVASLEGGVYRIVSD